MRCRRPQVIGGYRQGWNLPLAFKGNQLARQVQVSNSSSYFTRDFNSSTASGERRYLFKGSKMPQKVPIFVQGLYWRAGELENL